MPEYQYKDYVFWQKSNLDNGNFNKQKKYWDDLFSDGLPKMNFFKKKKEINVFNVESNKSSIIIDSDLYRDIQKLLKEKKVTSFMILVAVYNILLSKYTGKSDFVVGILGDGRKSQHFDKTIGMFVNTMLLRSLPLSSKKFSDFLEETKKHVIGALDNQDYPFEEYLHNDTKNKLLNTLISIGNYNPNSSILNTENLKFKFINIENNISKFDIILELINLEKELLIRVNSNRSIFSEKDVK